MGSDVSKLFLLTFFSSFGFVFVVVWQIYLCRVYTLGGCAGSTSESNSGGGRRSVV